MAAKNANMGNMGMLSGWFLALGILFVLFGFVLIMFPVAGTFSLEMLLGLLLLVLGIAQMAMAFAARKWGGFMFVLAGAVLSLLLGGMLLFRPLAAAVILTLLLGIFLALQGVVRIGMAIGLKNELNRGWLLFDGAITLLLGMLVILGWPVDSVWVIGLLFGISLFFNGISFIVLSSVFKK